MPSAPMGWLEWGKPNSHVEDAYTYLGPRKMTWTNAPFCVAADVFFWDTGDDGVSGGTFYGAPKCHGDGYYYTLFSDISVRKFVDRTNLFKKFKHYDQDVGLMQFTALLR